MNYWQCKFRIKTVVIRNGLTATRSQIANIIVSVPLLREYATRRFIALFVLVGIQYECLSKTRIEAALLVEARFVSQQVVYHGTGDENITSHFNRQRAGKFWLGKISQMSAA